MQQTLRELAEPLFKARVPRTRGHRLDAHQRIPPATHERDGSSGNTPGPQDRVTVTLDFQSLRQKFVGFPVIVNTAFQGPDGVSCLCTESMQNGVTPFVRPPQIRVADKRTTESKEAA